MSREPSNGPLNASSGLAHRQRSWLNRQLHLLRASQHLELQRITQGGRLHHGKQIGRSADIALTGGNHQIPAAQSSRHSGTVLQHLLDEGTIVFRQLHQGIGVRVVLFGSANGERHQL